MAPPSSSSSKLVPLVPRRRPRASLDSSCTEVPALAPTAGLLFPLVSTLSISASSTCRLPSTSLFFFPSAGSSSPFPVARSLPLGPAVRLLAVRRGAAKQQPWAPPSLASYLPMSFSNSGVLSSSTPRQKPLPVVGHQSTWRSTSQGELLLIHTLCIFSIIPDHHPKLQLLLTSTFFAATDHQRRARMVFDKMSAPCVAAERHPHHALVAVLDLTGVVPQRGQYHGESLKSA